MFSSVSPRLLFISYTAEDGYWFLNLPDDIFNSKGETTQDPLAGIWFRIEKGPPIGPGLHGYDESGVVYEGMWSNLLEILFQIFVINTAESNTVKAPLRWKTRPGRRRNWALEIAFLFIAAARFCSLLTIAGYVSSVRHGLRESCDYWSSCDCERRRLLLAQSSICYLSCSN